MHFVQHPLILDAFMVTDVLGASEMLQNVYSSKLGKFYTPDMPTKFPFFKRLVRIFASDDGVVVCSTSLTPASHEVVFD